MKDLITEFQDVFTLYLKLSEELTKVLNADDTQDPRVLVKSVLQNRHCLDRIAQMNSHVVHLSDSWKKCRAHLDPDSRKKIRDLTEAARAQAARLQELCCVQAQKLQTARDELGEKLGEMGKGARYLNSMKPVKHNYPKFIDSLY
jgi:hypothetical protein